MARKFIVPFGVEGEREEVPNPLQLDGSVSMTRGFGTDYELEDTDPNYKPFPRKPYNGLMFDITDAIFELQSNGLATWALEVAPYEINALTRHAGVNWRSAISNNSSEPGTNSDWLAADVNVPASLKTSGIAGATSNLKASATGTNSTVTVAADAICLKSSSNEPIVINSLDLAINSASVGANGLDTGVLVASTWYAIWVIYNPVSGVAAGLLSLSSNNPAMPVGYTHRARVGWTRTDPTTNKFPLGFSQVGRRVQYKVAAGSNVTGARPLAAGAAGNTTSPGWISVSVSAAVPPTAAIINGVISSTTSAAQAVAAPNNNYGGYLNSANPAAVSASGALNATPEIVPFSFVLESTNIFWASSAAGGYISCTGWEDNL